MSLLLEDLLQVENKWRTLARERLDAEAKEGIGKVGVEFLQRTEVLGRSVDVPIALEELKRVGEMARYINEFKIKDSAATAAKLKEGLGMEMGPSDLVRLTCLLAEAKIVHDRRYVETYAFWKAVEMLKRGL
ncbi:MAG: hypothetical protein HY555_00655 [Euryarchaeota archaeon]|nr:hypothetical protein [Euryarchaeota archaeon]